jgi:hypothetical protein
LTNADGSGEQEPMADALAYLTKKPMPDADGSSQYPSLQETPDLAESALNLHSNYMFAPLPKKLLPNY